MVFPEKETVDQLRKDWTAAYVKIIAGKVPALARFENKVGKVITINYSGAAIVDFADGAWYDISNFVSALEKVTDEAEIKKYNPEMNSAQLNPARQS